MAALDGVLAKLDRAEEHLTELDAELGRYLKREPHTLVRYQKPGASEIAVAWQVTEPPPLRAAAILGDTVHNLRSSLDHLAWELVKLDGREPSIEPPRTQFPIFDTRPRSPVTIRPGISAAAQSLVEPVQPYHEGEGFDMHPLSILNELVNRDKHRELNLTATRSQQSYVYLVDPKTGSRIGGQFNAGVIHHNDVVAGFRLPEGISKVPDDWEIQAQGAMFVALEGEGPWRDWPVVPFIDIIRVYIRDTVVGNARQHLFG